VAGDDLQSSLLILNPPGSLLRRFTVGGWRRLAVIVTHIEPSGFAAKKIRCVWLATTCSHRYSYWTLRVRC